MAERFLKLDDFILPPPLGPIVAVLVVLGTWWLSDAVARRLFGRETDALARGGCFAATVGAIAALSHAFAWSGHFLTPFLQILGSGLALAGLVQLTTLGRNAPQVWRQEGVAWRSLTLIQRIAAALAMLITLGFVLSALGPPTDADSLDYHLGVPLDWLRMSSAYARYDWFHARLVGLGEALNLLGLAVGTDQLGATYQTSGLFVAFVAVSAFAKVPADRVLAALLVAATPLMAQLASSQKPMLLPAASIAVALGLLVRQRGNLNYREVAVALGAAAFAVGCKLSFILSGFAVFGAALIIGLRHGALVRVALIGALAVLLLPAPTWIRTYLFYGDPISPFLERVRSSPDSGVVAFATYLRDFGGEHSWVSYLRLSLNLVLPDGLGNISTVLGVGVFSWLFICRSRGVSAWLFGCSVGAAILSLALAQLTARFFLEPYLWSAMALVSMEIDRKYREPFLSALALQGCVVLTMAWFAALTIAPGSLSREWRASVMERAAYGFAETRWMDQVLPSDAVVYAQVRSHALLPRRFVNDDNDFFSWDERRLVTLLRDGGVNVIIYDPDAESPFAEFVARYTVAIGESERFSFATRNPFNRSPTYRLRAMRFDWKGSRAEAE